ncbi:hypothetical protein L2750_16940 [Shewanella submarina]|uniref:Ion channel protein Tsx n=1 Tax=Shewanella submarina TaxID=2016376 RepID=A0ABV7GFJ2_9GAMM|nr:hypothetical protein [Shewanella submarina]MCL1038817.1 hypothetical protein [Shewanella submarina]
MQRFAPLAALIASTTGSISAAQAVPTDYEIITAWDSNYVQQGRDTLDDTGRFWALLSANWQSVTLYSELVRGDSQDYSEAKFGVEYGFDTPDNIELSAGYHRIEFYGLERAHDNEVFADLAYTGWDWLTPSANYTYATENSGYFIELAVAHEWQLSEQWVLVPYLLQGFDYGYVTEEHDGNNHTQIGIEASWQWSDKLSATLHLHHAFIGTDIRREYGGADLVPDGSDITWGGVLLTWVID